MPLVCSWLTPSGYEQTSVWFHVCQRPNRAALGPSTETLTIGLREPETLADGSYLAAFRINIQPSSDDFLVVNEKVLTRYIVVTKLKTNINEGAESIEGTPIEDRTGWTYKAEGQDYSADMFDGTLYPGGWWFSMDDVPLRDEVTVEVDMTKVQTIIGWQMGYYDYAASALKDVEVSVDGEKWERQANGVVSLAIPWSGQWQYLVLRSPVECRYIRMTYLRKNNYRFGSSEFQAVAPKN